jgi:hypothetical protein
MSDRGSDEHAICMESDRIGYENVRVNGPKAENIDA